MPPQYGYQSYYTPPKPKPAPGSLASAAAGTPTSPSNPFGLSGANSMRDAQGGYSPAAPVARPAAKVAQRTPQVTAPTNVQAQQAAAPSTAPTPGGYDINTDPALQQITASTGLSDEQANALALKQRTQQVIALGDPTVAAGVLGAGDPNVAAAAGNPTSALAQIDTQYQRNLHALDEQLNQANLGYSGYRITQEQQAAQDKLGQVASATDLTRGNLDTIGSNLANALLTNRTQRENALNAAALAAQKAQVGSGAAGPLNDAGYPANTTPAALGVTPSPITSALVAPPMPLDTRTVQPPASPSFNATAPIPAPPGPGSQVVGALANALLSGGVPRTPSGYGTAAQRRRQTLL